MSDSPLAQLKLGTASLARRNLRSSYLLLCTLWVLLAVGTLLVIGMVHRQTPARKQPQGVLSDAGTDVPLIAGPGGTRTLMATPSGLDLQPDITEEYMLLGAPTAMCWKNATMLDKAFPKSSTCHARLPRGQAASPHLCRLNMGQVNSTPVQLLHRARELLPCGAHASNPCSPGQVYMLQYVMHAAAHATLRYYLPPGRYHSAQLQHSLAMNPLLCGPHVYDPPDVAMQAQQQQQQQQTPLLAAACALLPGLLQLMGAVASHGETVDGWWDPTLPDLPGKFNPLLHDAMPEDDGMGQDPYMALSKLAEAADEAAKESPQYLLAFALYNNEQVIPHYLLQVLAMVTYLPPGRVLVSCYESGSTDSTPEWLQLMQGLLDMLHIPNHIVIQGNLTRGNLTRIAFLAAVRNEALAPLYDPAIYKAAMQRVGKEVPHGHEQPIVGYPADKIMYVNDPFWSWQDIVRLTHHEGDLICGMDFQDTWGTLIPDVWPLVPDPKKRRLLADMDDDEEVAEEKEDATTASMLSAEQQADEDLHGPARQLKNHPIYKTLIEPIPAFYDLWVARDMVGKPFYWIMPMVHDKLGLTLLTQGLPTPVQCCWNAAAVLNAAPFKPGGVPEGTAGAGGPKRDRLIFRDHGDGECAASECSLLCNDLWRLNFRRVLVDPSVRITYHPQIRNYLHGTVMNGMPALKWSDMTQMMQEQQISFEGNYTAPAPPPEVLCCPIPPERNHVVWEDCFMDKQWMADPNMTSTGMAHVPVPTTGTA